MKTPPRKRPRPGYGVPIANIWEPRMPARRAANIQAAAETVGVGRRVQQRDVG